MAGTVETVQTSADFNYFYMRSIAKPEVDNLLHYAPVVTGGPPGSLNRVPASAGGKGVIIVITARWQLTLCDCDPM